MGLSAAAISSCPRWSSGGGGFYQSTKPCGASVKKKPPIGKVLAKTLAPKQEPKFSINSGRGTSSAVMTKRTQLNRGYHHLVFRSDPGSAEHRAIDGALLLKSPVRWMRAENCVIQPASAIFSILHGNTSAVCFHESPRSAKPQAEAIRSTRMTTTSREDAHLKMPGGFS